MHKRLRILTWHVHGNYLYYLTQVPHDFYLFTEPDGGPERQGRVGSLPWGDNVHNAPVGALAGMEFDAVLYQSRAAWNIDRWKLPAAHRRLPALYLEHDPPRQTPTDTRHWVNDPDVLMVHVTSFNDLMWDCGETPTVTIEHGVKLLADAVADYSLPRGITAINNLDRRGRRLGADVFDDARAVIPLDLVGMGAERFGYAGEIENSELPNVYAKYRFFFNPIRYTSLGLAIIEAMMVGLPVVGLATTELVTVIRNGDNGYVDTQPRRLYDAMQSLIDEPAEAARMGANARRTAYERFPIQRFVDDWMRVLDRATA